MSIFTKTTAYVAHKSAKVIKGSGGTIKNFVSEVRSDMKIFDELDKQKAASKEFVRNMVIDGDPQE